MYKRKDFEESMPKDVDIMVHIRNIKTVPKKAVQLEVSGNYIDSGKLFKEHTTEIFHPSEVLDTVIRLLTLHNIKNVELVDVHLYQ